MAGKHRKAPMASRDARVARAYAPPSEEQLKTLLEAMLRAKNGDFSVRLPLVSDGVLADIFQAFNGFVEINQKVTDEHLRIRRVIGQEGHMGERANLAGLQGSWKLTLDAINLLIEDLIQPISEVGRVIISVAEGDLTHKMPLEIEGVAIKGEFLQIGTTVNQMVDQLNAFAGEVTRVAREVGSEGKLGGQAQVKGVSGTWKDLTESVNFMAGNLTNQVRNIAQVSTAVAKGDLSQKITVDVRGEMLELKNTLNTMVDQLNSFASEVTRVAREVGSEGKLGGQAEVKGVSGTWRDLTDSVNFMAGNLTNQVRNIAQVSTAIAKGDLSQKITVDVKGEMLELKNTINTMVDQLNAFAGEVTRVAREVGSEGMLGGQAQVKGVSGTWKDLTESVNFMAGNLTNQVRNIAQVSTAIAKGDLSQKITVDVKGEILELKNTINTMVDQLNSFASEVTRVAREVGSEGKLGGQAQVKGVSGTWRDLTESVNFMAGNLTNQVRGIVQVVTAVANGDLKKKLRLEVRGEIADLAETINNMTDTLSLFSDQVISVAREVGIEGKLGGQAKVPGVSGTWKDLTDNVNQLAENLTNQVRAIAEVSTAVTKGDLSRSISIHAKGEVAELKDNINQMIANLRATTKQNTEQDWLKTNLAKFTGLMQGQKSLMGVAKLIMSELTPAVGGQHGVFYLAESGKTGDSTLKLISSYAYRERKNLANRFHLGEGLVGQSALEKQSILLSHVPDDYIKISSGLGEGSPVNIIVLPVIFEGEVKAIIELASFEPFSPIHQSFLEQLMDRLGVVMNTISATMRTEELLQELTRSNAMLEGQTKSLEDKARLLEVKNKEVELASASLEEKAKQLAQVSKYKSEFLANMSHELRTPLNSIMILAKLLAENKDQNLTPKQVEFSSTVYTAGNDLLNLINEILDLSKVESGKMEIAAKHVSLDDLLAYLEVTFRPMAQQKGLDFLVMTEPGTPDSLYTDEQRLQQILKNLLSNAFKFTEHGQIVLRIGLAEKGTLFRSAGLKEADQVLAFSITDTGPGIPKDKQSVIFEAFQQADSSIARKYGGTGLGLTISREIANLLGGEIHLQSEVGKGSTFTLFLPRKFEGPIAPRPVFEARRPEAIANRLSVTMLEEPLAEAKPSEPKSGEPSELAVADDRNDLKVGDKVLLIVEDDLAFARILLTMAREKGFKGIIAPNGETAIALIQRYHPNAISLDLKMPDVSGWDVMNWIRSHPRYSQIPVFVISVVSRPEQENKLGAFAYLQKPVAKEQLESLLGQVSAILEKKVGSVLVLDSDAAKRNEIMRLLEAENLELTAVATGAEAIAALKEKAFDCLVTKGGIADMTPEELWERLGLELEIQNLPLLIHVGQDLSEADMNRLKHLAAAFGYKPPAAPMHEPSEPAPPSPPESHPPGEAQALLSERTVLIVDDDVRSIFALASALEAYGMTALFAENGQDGISTLKAHPDIDLVLMDIMMPEMSGYDAMRIIRAIPAFKGLPIIALTAKAMPGDREEALKAGASDYIAKPVDLDQLVALLSRWLPAKIGKAG
ncbi:HAMP domain-containing protein [bacterium]|nr:HAMP domain-containing protein [bacterium]